MHSIVRLRALHNRVVRKWQCHAQQVEEHRAAASRVADHWKAEAARHEAAAAAAQAPQMKVTSWLRTCSPSRLSTCIGLCCYIAGFQ